MTNELRDQLRKSSDWWSRAQRAVRNHSHLDTSRIDRTAEQNALIKSLMKTIDVPCDGEAVFVGGMPGSGKSTMLPAVVDPSKYFILDPDDIKVAMIEAGMCPEVEGLTPLECGPLIHYESTQIAKKLASKLIKKQTNIVWPMTFAALEAVETRVAWCKNYDYESIDGLYVTVSLETSTRRVKERHREGLEQYLEGIGYGGRFIDLDNIERFTGTGRYDAARQFFRKARIIDNEFDLV